MLQASSIHFLKELENNNNKPWFDENRNKYEATKAGLEKLVSSLIPAIAAFDEPLGTLQVKDCTFRINRDVRFSKNKSPYKNNMGASFSRGGKKADIAGYYFHFQPGKSFAGGGFYLPPPAQLSKIRQELDYSFAEWKTLLDNKTFKKYFPDGVDGLDTLIRPPKGYDENNPAIHYLKMKSFIVSKPFTDAELQSKSLVKDIAKTFEAMKPMLDFLNRAVE
ncbi:MAG: DUF2461 domain-containing protein [Ferruginibacter sp.]|nr:DUF2461 domain-containing protein [Ferruginibacter sp.]